MGGLKDIYDRAVGIVSGRFFEGLVLLFTRIVLAHVFWASGRTKVVEGSWLTISDTTYFLFENEYSGVPLIPSNIAAHMATYSETFFPILLVLGLATRFSALALMGMTLVIQIFVYPDAWWTFHSLWLAMAVVLVSRGGGMFSADALIARKLA